MAGWRSRSTGQDETGQLALSAVAAAFLIAAISLGGKLTYRYGMQVTRQADDDGKLCLDRLAGIGRRIRAGLEPLSCRGPSAPQATPPVKRT
jgi:hypothetical protein